MNKTIAGLLGAAAALAISAPASYAELLTPTANVELVGWTQVWNGYAWVWQQTPPIPYEGPYYRHHHHHHHHHHHYRDYDRDRW